MILVRVIPISELSTSQINNLHQFGFTLVHKPTEIQVWVEKEMLPRGGAHRG